MVAANGLERKQSFVGEEIYLSLWDEPWWSLDELLLLLNA